MVQNISRIHYVGFLALKQEFVPSFSVPSKEGSESLQHHCSLLHARPKQL